MSIFDFLKKNRPPEDASCQDGELTEMSRKIDSIINQVTLEIVTVYKDELLRQPVEYIAPAIWGAKMDGALDPAQQGIFSVASTAEQEIVRIFNVTALSREQRFALQYLVKWLMISRIAHMREILRIAISTNTDTEAAANRNKLQ